MGVGGKHTVVCIALALMAFAGAAHAAPALDKRAFAKIDDVAQHWVTGGHTPGLAVGVMRDGKILFAKGYGLADLENSTPVTPDTVFRIGSLTKQFTAAAVLTLVEKGQVSLDAPLSDYFPEFYLGRQVTVRQLLTHTSGISAYSDRTNPKNSWDYRSDLSTAQMVDRIEHFYPPYQFPPGSAWHYSNSGYFLLGAIVEKVSGRSLAEYLRQEVFPRAGLTNTALDDGVAVVPHRASGYEVTPGGGYRRADFLSMTVPGGAGAMRSTISDLLKWHEALFSGRVVSGALVKEMIAPARLSDGRLASSARVASGEPPLPDFEYGFGLFIAKAHGHRRINHNGGINGFNATLNTYPDDHLTWVALSNSGGGVSARDAKLGTISGVSEEIEEILIKNN